MAFASHMNTTAQGAFSKRVAGIIESLRDRLARRKVYMTTHDELSALSNRDLADLGIARSEIKYLAHEAAYGE